MTLIDDLRSGVDYILKTSWDLRDGRVVPTSEDISLTWGGVRFDGTVLYADLAQSSQLATEFQQRTAAKVIKSFLFCCTKIITAHGGTITSFDGDRVMGIFIGDSKNTSATTTALKIKFSVLKVIKPKVEDYFASMSKTSWEIDHAVGIDTSSILAVRAGQRGSNDLIWVGRSPNFAAKLSEIREPYYKSYISEDVYNAMGDSPRKEGTTIKICGSNVHIPGPGKVGPSISHHGGGSHNAMSYECCLQIYIVLMRIEHYK